MRKHTEPSTEWRCPKCGSEYESPIPVVGVMCRCSKRTSNREQWMKPKESE